MKYGLDDHIEMDGMRLAVDPDGNTTWLPCSRSSLPAGWSWCTRRQFSTLERKREPVAADDDGLDEWGRRVRK